MTTTDRPASLGLGRGVRASFCALLALSVAAAGLRAALAVGDRPSRPDIVDFHPFYLAGRLALEGHFIDSYRAPTMRALERAFGGGRDVWMPFAYPPPFGLLMAPFASLPVWLALPLFVSVSLALYLAMLRRLAGNGFWPLAFALAPVLLLNIQGGQNGLLTGGLAGLSAWGSLGGRPALAGVAAGLLAFKPQTATMLPALFLGRRDGRALATAALTATVFTALAVLAFGWDSLAAFRSSVASVAEAATRGGAPLHRMASPFASAISLGAPPSAAVALQSATAVVAVAAAVVLARRLSARGDEPGAAGLALTATAFISPYFFDYDLAVYGVGLAALAPALARALSPRALAALLAGVALAGASGLLEQAARDLIGMPDLDLSLGSPTLIACQAAVLRALWRGGAPVVAAGRPSDQRSPGSSTR